MKDKYREHLMDLINDGLDYEDIMNEIARMQDEEEAEEDNELELEEAMEEAADALTEFFFIGMSIYGLVEDEAEKTMLRDNILESLIGVKESLQRTGKLKADLTKLDKQVRAKGEANSDDLMQLKKMMAELFK